MNHKDLEKKLQQLQTAIQDIKNNLPSLQTSGGNVTLSLEQDGSLRLHFGPASLDLQDAKKLSIFLNQYFGE